MRNGGDGGAGRHAVERNGIALLKPLPIIPAARKLQREGLDSLLQEILGR
jgi:hypothetical protein